MFIDVLPTNHETVRIPNSRFPICSVNRQAQKARMATLFSSPRLMAQNKDLVRTIRGVKIAATGSFPAEKRVRNEDLSELGCDPDWIVQRTGIAPGTTYFPAKPQAIWQSQRPSAASKMAEWPRTKST